MWISGPPNNGNAEGLHVAETIVPTVLAGKTLAEAAIPQQTQCTVVALRRGDQIEINPRPDVVLDPKAELILICTPESEAKFLNLYKVQTIRHEPISTALKEVPERTE